MTTMPPPFKPAKPATKPSEPKPALAPPQMPAVQFGQIASATGHRFLIYGPGGIGKTTLAACAPGPVAFFDLEESLPRLRSALSLAGRLEALRPVKADSWAAIRAALASPGWESINTIVIDSGTRAEELAIAHTLAAVPNDKGNKVARLDDYGYGKGFQHAFETFLPLMADLDSHARAGRNVVVICHDCTANVPNPTGDDWLRYEPRLQSPASGKASIRLRLREWADHVIFLGYDVSVKDRKGSGAGTRTAYPAELPHCMAKSRTIAESFPMEDAAAFWQSLIS